MTSRSVAGTAAEGRGPRKRDAVWTRNPPAPDSMNDIIGQGCGLRWHGPTHAFGAGAPLVGAPKTTAFGGGARDGYGVVAPRRTVRAGALWGRGIPGTRALARVAAHCTPAAGC